MNEIKQTLEQLFDAYLERYEDVLPVMQLMGISDEALYVILDTALMENKPLELQVSTKR